MASQAPQTSLEVIADFPVLAKRRLRSNRYLTVGGIIVAVLVAVSILAPVLAPYNPDTQNLMQHLLPIGSPGHPLGTDALGRDMLSRLLYGGRTTLLAGVASSLLSTSVGVLLGVTAGYFGRVTDTLIMRSMDILMSFPFILLAILIVAFAGPSTFHALLAIAFANLPFFARIVRSETLKVRRYDFVDAAGAQGAGHSRIIIRHILPNLIPLVFSTLFMNVGWMISQTSALSFLGFGTQPPTPDWGSMLAEAQNYMAIRGDVAMLPGILIVLAVIGFNLFGMGLKASLLREREV